MEQMEGLRIPPEVFAFFTAPGGHSLIVRGNAGTGKTTFALQVIEDLSRVEVGYYVSTRVSDQSLLLQFPWLKDRLISSLTVRPPSADDRPSRIRGGLTKLKGIGSHQAGPIRKEMSISIGKDLTDLECLYDMVEADTSKRRTFVIDSVDAMAERYNLDPALLIASLQKDLVEGYGQNLLYVLESPEQLLDYLGDGVIVMKRSDVDRRRVREIELLKLRGCEITRPRYLFTLRGGKIMTFNEDVARRDGPVTNWAPIPDADGRVSSGLPDLDRLIGGGIEKGSIILLEVGQSVPLRMAEAIERAFVSNFVMTGRGVIWFPSRRTSPDMIRGQMSDVVSKERFEKQVRIPEVASQVELSAPFIMPVEGANAAIDLKWRNISYMLGGGDQPYLSLLGFDTLESIYGDKVMDQVMDHLGAMKRNKGVCVCVTSSSSGSRSRLADLAGVHLKIDRIGGTTIIYGERPFTECNAITFDGEGLAAKVSLTPVV